MSLFIRLKGVLSKMFETLVPIKKKASIFETRKYNLQSYDIRIQLPPKRSLLSASKYKHINEVAQSEERKERTE